VWQLTQLPLIDALACTLAGAQVHAGWFGQRLQRRRHRHHGAPGDMAAEMRGCGLEAAALLFAGNRKLSTKGKVKYRMIEFNITKRMNSLMTQRLHLPNALVSDGRLRPFAAPVCWPGFL